MHMPEQLKANIYTFVPSSIAALLTVLQGTKEYSCIYMSKERGVVIGIGELPLIKSELPIGIQAEINKYFGALFSLPASSRDTYLKSVIPWELTIWSSENI